MSTSPATVMTVQPPWRRTCTTSASSMACSPPVTRGGRAGQGRVRRGELAGVPGQEGGDLGDPGGDALGPGAGRVDVGQAPQPLVSGTLPAGAADAGAGAEDQRPVRAVAGDAGPEGDHGDLPAVPDGVGVADAAVAGLPTQLPPFLSADRAAIPVVVQGLHHRPGPRAARYHLLALLVPPLPGRRAPGRPARQRAPAGLPGRGPVMRR